MIKINEIETDQHIIVSEDRIKELVIEIYSMIIDKSNLTLNEYNQLQIEIDEILDVYKTIPDSQILLDDILELREILNLYAKDMELI